MLRRLLNPIVILGAAIIGLCWCEVVYQLHSDYTETVNLAVERGDSMAKLFEKDTIRLLKGIDTTLLLLRQAYETDPENFDLVKTARQSGMVGDVATEFGQITSSGYLVQTTSGQLGAPIYLGDRKHFIAQLNNPEDELFISDPVFLRSTGKYLIPVARRLRAPDGSFAGILTGQVDPLFVEQFSQTLKLGPGSNISIRGLDGVLRASYGFVKPPVQQTAVMKEAMTHAPNGYFWGGGAADNVTRLVTYRSLSDFPLVITIGESEEHIFASFHHHRLIYVSIAAALALVTIMFVVIILQRQSTLERTNSRLETVNGRFDTALSHITQGITMYDGDHKLVVWNDRFAKIYGFPTELITVGRPFRELIAYQVKTGNIGQDPDRYMAMRMERLSKDRFYSPRAGERRLGLYSRGHHGSQEFGDPDRAIGAFRHPYRSGESQPLQGAGRGDAVPLSAARRRICGRPSRPRQIQGRQRYARPPERRRAAQGRRQPDKSRDPRRRSRCPSRRR
jgi:PAS domain-containing protein